MKNAKTKMSYPAKIYIGAKLHKYAGAGHTAYVGLLEINEPPNGKERFVVDAYNVNTWHTFCETNDLKIATNAFNAVASGFYDNLFMEWKRRGIEKMYQTLSIDAQPWFYMRDESYLFGAEKQFSTNKKLSMPARIMSASNEFLVFSKNDGFSFEKVAGVIDETIIWQSSRSDFFSQNNKISVDKDQWENKLADLKWKKFLRGELETDNEIVIEFPMYSLEFTLNRMGGGVIAFNLWLSEEFKGPKIGRTYYKNVDKIPPKLYQMIYEDGLLVEVLKFFIQE